MQKFARPVFYLALAFTFIMAVLPHPPRLPWQPDDKIQHLAAFATLSALALSAFPKRSLFSLLVGLGLFGALIELVQAIPALNRDSDILDLVADTLSSAIVLTLFTIAKSLWSKSRQTEDPSF